MANPNELEGAAIAATPGEAKVASIEFGFNRSINAIKPIGSLVKPFIYLTALNKYDQYTLTTFLMIQNYHLKWRRNFEPTSIKNIMEKYM